MISYMRPYDPKTMEELLKKLEEWRKKIPKMNKEQFEKIIKDNEN